MSEPIIGNAQQQQQDKKMEDKKKNSIWASRFKSKVCENFKDIGNCTYGFRCMFAHGKDELRTKEMNFRDGLITEESIKGFQEHRRTEQLEHQRQQTQRSTFAAQYSQQQELLKQQQQQQLLSGQFQVRAQVQTQQSQQMQPPTAACPPPIVNGGGFVSQQQQFIAPQNQNMMHQPIQQFPGGQQQYPQQYQQQSQQQSQQPNFPQSMQNGSPQQNQQLYPTMPPQGSMGAPSTPPSPQQQPSASVLNSPPGGLDTGSFMGPSPPHTQPLLQQAGNPPYGAAQQLQLHSQKQQQLSFNQFSGGGSSPMTPSINHHHTATYTPSQTPLNSVELSNETPLCMPSFPEIFSTSTTSVPGHSVALTSPPYPHSSGGSGGGSQAHGIPQSSINPPPNVMGSAPPSMINGGESGHEHGGSSTTSSTGAGGGYVTPHQPSDNSMGSSTASQGLSRRYKPSQRSNAMMLSDSLTTYAKGGEAPPSPGGVPAAFSNAA